MITMRGIIKDVYAKEAFINPSTGVTTPPKFYAQFETVDQRSGRVAFIDVRVQDIDEAKGCLEKLVQVEIGCYPWVNEQTGNASVSYSQMKDTKIKVASSSTK